MHNQWFLIPFGVLFAIVGGINALNPKLAWRMNRWQYKDKSALEPSAAGMIMSRVIGSIFVVVGIVVVVIGIVSLAH